MGKDDGMELGHAVQPAEIDYTVDDDDALDPKNQQHNAPVDVWENGDGTGVDFRTLSWIKAAALETKLQIGLGILSIPSVLDTLGMAGGLLVVTFTGFFAFWCQFQVGEFKKVHPEAYSCQDVGMILAGPIGREVGGFLVWLFMFMVGGAAFVGASVSLNAMSIHGTCTVVFVAVCAIISAVIGSFRTLSKISWISWVGVTGILSAVITLAVAVSLQDRPSAAPKTGPWDKDLKVMGYPTFVAGLGAVSNVFFGYAGAPYYFAIVSEFRDARQYPKSILLSQGVTMGAFIGVGTVVYYYCGQYVSSPALGSAGPLLKRICYGLAFPGLLVTGILNVHLSAKYIFVRVLRNSRHLTQSTMVHWTVWIGLIIANAALSFIFAEAVPVFGDIVGLVGSICATPLAYGLPLVIWFYINRPKINTSNPKVCAIAAINVILLLATAFLTVAGTYANIVSIKQNAESGTGRSFSCADNSGSVAA